MLAVYLLLLAFNFMTPMAGDDYAHYFGISGEHVDSLGEIGENLRELWLHVNGRVAPHLLVYLMQIPPRAVFRLLNAGMLPLVLVLLLRYLPGEQRRRWEGALLAFLLLWLFLPAFGEVFLWLTGSCNYGWSLPLLLLALAPFYQAALGREGRMGVLPHALLCLLCGFYSEIGGIGLIACGFLLLVMAGLREKRIPWRLLGPFALACVGFLLLLSAPATLSSRTGGAFSLHGLAKGLKAVVAALRAYFLPLLLLYALLFAWTWVRGGDKRVLAASLMLTAGAMAPALALATAAYLVGRSFTVTGLLTVLACLTLMGELARLGEKNKLASVAAVAAVLFAFSFLEGAGDILSLHMQARERAAVIRQARDRGESTVTLRAYVTTTAHSEIRDEGMDRSPDYWYNEELAQYYGFEKVYGVLPEDESP